MLPDVSQRETKTGGRFQAFSTIDVYNIGRNVGDRLVHGIRDSRHDYLCQVHAFVHNAIIRVITILFVRFSRLLIRV